MVPFISVEILLPGMGLKWAVIHAPASTLAKYHRIKDTEAQQHYIAQHWLYTCTFIMNT
jgi:hypothetical protein